MLPVFAPPVFALPVFALPVFVIQLPAIPAVPVLAVPLLTVPVLAVPVLAVSVTAVFVFDAVPVFRLLFPPEEEVDEPPMQERIRKNRMISTMRIRKIRLQPPRPLPPPEEEP